MAEVQIAINKKEINRAQVWVDLARKAVPPWEYHQQFIDVGWDLLNLLSPSPEIIMPEESFQQERRGGMNLIMNHYFFPEIPIVSAVIEELSRYLHRDGMVTAIANMPQNLIIPNSVPILIPPVHYFKRYNRSDSKLQNIISGPEPLLYLFNQFGFISADNKTGVGQLSSEERVALNMNSAFEMVDRMEANQEAIIYPSGDRMPGPQHPGFLGWTLMHQFLTTGHISPINFWVHEGFLPNELIKGITSKTKNPARLLCVDTFVPEQLDAMGQSILQANPGSSQSSYQDILRNNGARLGIGILDRFKERINSEYRKKYPNFNWNKYLKYTSKPQEV